MRRWRFALLGLRREWRSGEPRLLAAALILAIAAVTSVGFFTERVEGLLQWQGSELLAADLVIESSSPPADSLRDQAHSLGLSSALTLTFPSVVMSDGNPQLVQVKAVESGYPLRGQLLLRSEGGEAIPAAGTPATDEVWVEPRLLPLLGRELGADLSLGEASFRIGGLIELEPDRGGNLFQLAPRVMLGLQQIPATGLVTPASRVRYRLLLAGPADRVEAFRLWSQDHLPANARTLSIQDARPELRTALERGSRFLALAALVAVLVTGAAIALASRRMIERQSDAVAVMRCLGAQSGFLRDTLMLRLLMLLLITGLVGAALGYLAQLLLAQLLGDWFIQPLPAPSLTPLVTGLATGALTLFGFALPGLLRLPRVPPLRVLRRDLGHTPPGPWLLGLSAFAALAALLFWQAEDLKLAATVLGGAALLLTSLGLVSLLLIRFTGSLQQKTRGIWRFGLAALSRHPAATLLQLCGFGLGVMAILLLAVVRVDLLNAWEETLPEGTPNRFLINIQPDQIESLQAFLAEQGLDNAHLYPMIRGRLTHINDQPVVADAYENPRAQRLASREFNLSQGMQMQSDNRILKGRWWQQEEAPAQFSVEDGIAKTLGIALGDRLTFWVAGESVSAPVTSLRSVKWDSFNVNFFVVASPATLERTAATYITSFHLAHQREGVARELIQRFPNLTLLDVSSILGQVRRVMERGSTAVEYLFLFTLAAGLLVLYAGIQAGAESRRHEAAILRTLGASRRQLLGAAAIEFSALGLLAGLLATLGAFVIGQLLAQQIFQLEYGFSPWLWISGVGGSLLGIALAGLISAWPLLVQPPLRSLRMAE